MTAEPTKLPKKRSKRNQMMFDPSWCDRKLHSYHEGAVVVGDFFEEATSNLLSSARFLTDSTADTCPDVKEPSRCEFFVESKAMGLNTGRRFPLAEEQLKAYEAFVENYFPSMDINEPDWEPSLLFAFWMYELEEGKIGDYQYVNDLREILAKSVVALFLLDFDVVKGMLKNKKLENYKMYRPFYSLRRTDFRLLETDWRAFLKKVEIPINGHAFFSTQIKSRQVYSLKLRPFELNVLVDGHGMSKQAFRLFLSKVM